VTDAEFESFIASAYDELTAKQQFLASAWNLGSMKRFLFVQETSMLSFFDASEAVAVQALAVPIGSYAERSATWEWAWANESILPTLQTASASLRELASVTGMRVFELPIVNSSPELSWELTAIGVRHLGALGAYRAPGSPSDLYLAILSVESLAKAQGG
jgi:hypothetical protein